MTFENLCTIDFRASKCAKYGLFHALLFFAHSCCAKINGIKVIETRKFKVMGKRMAVKGTPMIEAQVQEKHQFAPVRKKKYSHCNRMLCLSKCSNIR